MKIPVLRDFCAGNGCDIGKLRTLAQNHFKLCQCVYGSLCHTFYGTVFEICYEAVQMQSMCMM